MELTLFLVLFASINYGYIMYGIKKNGRSWWWWLCRRFVFWRIVGRFCLTVDVNYLFFIGSHLVALSKTGKFGVWHAMTQNWQVRSRPFCTEFIYKAETISDVFLDK